MKKHKISKLKTIQCILSFMMLGSFLFLIIGEIIAPPENVLDGSGAKVYETEWVQVLENEERKAVEVPGKCEAEYNQWVTIETTMASDLKDTWFCVRSMQQEMKIYVDGELRKEYSTLESQPFGKTSTMTYVMFPLYESDGGKTLSIEFKSASSYAGYVSEMYIGNKSDIEQYFYMKYAPSAIIAAMLFLVGVVVLFACIFVRAYYKKKVDIIHLGNAILITAAWLLVESKLRQFIFPSSTIAMLTGFLLIAILPYPFLSYVNSVQNNRYKKVFAIIGACTAVNFAVVVTLQVLNIKDFVETMTSSHIIIIVLIIAMAVTGILDLKNGYVRAYREVAIGFVALMVAGICEIILVYVASAEINGISLSIGLVVLLIAAGLKSVRDMVNIEKEKQYAIATSESKAMFLANMSHEIRTPINTIVGMNEMIMRENKNEEIAEYSKNIKSASHMLLELINDVLDFSKIEAGKLQIIEGDYKVARMLNDVVLGIDVRAKQKGLELKLDIDENMPAVLKGDEIRIKQVLNNLLSNAVKYTEKGSITIGANGVKNENGFVLSMYVKDTGIGIKKEDMATLFDSFERFDTTKNKNVEGTGLGLNITQMLIGLMNGQIKVDSEYGKGSLFAVNIPQQIIDESPMGPLKDACKNEDREQVVEQNYLEIPDANILVVDDTKMNLLVIKHLLKRCGAKLDTAESGTECFELTKNKKYDIILMDHMMPEPDGIQTLHMIREDSDNLNIDTPIIVLTANAIVGMRDQYINEGFADYLSKPVEVDKLEEMLERYVR